jgi:uncharacterized protein (TIGR02271 family)
MPHEETRENDAALVRHEDELRVGKRVEEIGILRLSTSVTSDPIEGDFERKSEDAKISRERVHGSDSGQVETLSDGSVSIPLFEEELVISRRLVVRERVVIRKHTVSKTERVRDEVRREHVEVEKLDASKPETSS